MSLVQPAWPRRIPGWALSEGTSQTCSHPESEGAPERYPALPEGWSSPSPVVDSPRVSMICVMREKRPSVHDGLGRPALSQLDSELPSPWRRCSSPSNLRETSPPAVLRRCSEEVCTPTPREIVRSLGQRVLTHSASVLGFMEQHTGNEPEQFPRL